MHFLKSSFNFKMSEKTTPITIAYGDGIGPEIMHSTLQILKEAGAKISFNVIEVGKNIYEKGIYMSIS